MGPIGNLAPALYGISPSAFTDVLPVHQGDLGVVSGDLNSNTLFDFNGLGAPVTLGRVSRVANAGRLGHDHRLRDAVGPGLPE